MGALCFKQKKPSNSSGGANGGGGGGIGGGGNHNKKKSSSGVPEHGGTLGVMFNRFDKEKKGYISRQNLQDMMRDDKTHFQGRDVDHIMSKYGNDGKMDFTQFSTWWNSTYTTYNDSDIANLVDQVNADQQEEDRMETILETELPQDPHITNKAVGRS